MPTMSPIWTPLFSLLGTLVGALATFGGVAYNARATRARERDAKNQEIKMAVYTELLQHVDDLYRRAESATTDDFGQKPFMDKEQVRQAEWYIRAQLCAPEHVVTELYGTVTAIYLDEILGEDRKPGPTEKFAPFPQQRKQLTQALRTDLGYT